MDDNWPPASSHPGTLNYIPPNLCAFEPTTRPERSATINTLVWIGGLFDTLLSVSYPLVLAQALPATWSLAQVSLGSAGNSWGVSSIARDADEIGKIVAHFRQMRPGGRIVIMGHSTGCQDCMEYDVGVKDTDRPRVDGIILQAPVSDREALKLSIPDEQFDETVRLAQQMLDAGKGMDALPDSQVNTGFGKRLAITAKRWLDVASPPPNHAGADDYFSSDLSDQRLRNTFGRLSVPTLILYSGAEENAPPALDKEALVQNWTKVMKDCRCHVDDINSGIVPGASHNMNGLEEPVQDLCRRVLGFIERLDGDKFALPDISRF